MRIATWNVNGMRARLAFFLLWLRDRRPDVVGLQELKLTAEQFPHLELEAEGYRAVVHGQKGWNGVAIVSRGEATTVERGLPGEEEAGARLLTADVGGLAFTTVYVPNGKSVEHEDFPSKLRWLDALDAHLAAAPPERPAIVCGDFNLCPAPIDSWDEAAHADAIFHTEEERSRFRRLLERGWIDAFRQAHPDLPGYSWWDYRGGAFHRGQGLRIDLVLARLGAAARVREAWIDRDYRKKQQGLTPSDHAPLIVDLDLEAEEARLGS